jgi:uncharacterized metal-binding protein
VTRSPRARLAAACAAVAAAIAAGWLWLGPPGADIAAHVYQRWFFVHHGFALWDNYWYSGRYVFATYSWLTYPLAALLGVKLLFVLAIAVAAAAFAVLVDYPPAAWAFAVVWGCFALSGALPFAVGVAFALVALNTRRLYALFAALTWAASPVALLLLFVVVVGLRRWRAALLTLPLIALQLVLERVYPMPGHFPFSWEEAGAALILGVTGFLVARGRLRGVFLAWTVLIVLAFAIPSPLGENAARLRFLALPLGLLALRGRPLRLAIPLALVAASYNVTPLYASFRSSLDERAADAAYWQPAIRWLHAHRSPDFRVNALDTVGHWEAVYLPQAGIPITRGWFRQDDFPQNQLLYGHRRLTRRQYVRWLRSQGVRYVLVPRDALDYSSRREPALARTLRFCTRAGEITIYEVPRATPIAPGAVVERFTHDSVTLHVRRGATPRRLAIRDGDGDWRALTRRGTYTLRFP